MVCLCDTVLDDLFLAAASLTTEEAAAQLSGGSWVQLQTDPQLLWKVEDGARISQPTNVLRNKIAKYFGHLK